MTEKEMVFYQSAVAASDGKDGNFEFSCPHCGGYSIGTRKDRFGLIMASCGICKIFIKEQIIIEKGA